MAVHVPVTWIFAMVVTAVCSGKLSHELRKAYKRGALSVVVTARMYTGIMLSAEVLGDGSADGALAALPGDGSVVPWGVSNFGADGRAVQGQLRNAQQLQDSFAVLGLAATAVRSRAWRVSGRDQGASSPDLR
jgi:hypothetical protein